MDRIEGLLEQIGTIDGKQRVVQPCMCPVYGAPHHVYPRELDVVRLRLQPRKDAGLQCIAMRTTEPEHLGYFDFAGRSTCRLRGNQWRVIYARLPPASRQLVLGWQRRKLLERGVTASGLGVISSAGRLLRRRVCLVQRARGWRTRCCDRRRRGGSTAWSAGSCGGLLLLSSWRTSPTRAEGRRQQHHQSE